MTTHPLLRVLERTKEIHQSKRLPVVVFDLDSTLFATAGRNKIILDRFLASNGSGNPKLKAAIEAIEYADLGWDIQQPLIAKGITDPTVLADLMAFWKRCFFTDEYVVHDHPNPGAVDYVKQVHESGALVYYLTGRHIDGMSLGTVESLTKNGFPYWRGRTLLHLKQSFTLDDALYKIQAITDINSHMGEVVATFDNEPANCNIFQKSFPNALNFFVDTEHSPNAAPLNSQLIHIPDFVYPASAT